MSKLVYNFADGKADGEGSSKNLLGGKGANLAEMCNLGLPVPPGFTITTEVCTSYYDNNKQYPPDLDVQIQDSIKLIEEEVGAEFGATDSMPLLVSVRSGARASMPGMMDTILNLGLNDETVIALGNATGNERFAYDSYRRFIQMYSDVVLGVDHFHFEEILDSVKQDKNVTLDTELDANDMKILVERFKEKVSEEKGEAFVQDIQAQLKGAINAVFDSWMNPRADKYRELNDIPASWGTAVNVQAMVFGNMGETSATGVAFTRNPSTGENKFYGEFLINAQGEDVVAGIRTPKPICEMAKMGDVYDKLVEIYQKLESHYKDMQDIEFTVQNGKLWMLQTRSGKRTAEAAIRIAVDMVEEGLIDKEEAILRIAPESLDQLLHPKLDPHAKKEKLTAGLPASPGAACGSVVFSADEAERQAAIGDKVILVRIETSPEDIHGMHAAQGILTARGGMTSHAAVVARGMGKPCVSGAGEVKISYAKQTMQIGGREINSGDKITINGSTGEVFPGEVPTIKPELSGDFATIMSWADEIREMKIRTNAETPKDVAAAREFGAQGIGLCRTEHMFFEADRINSMREMIIAEDEAGRKAALEKLLPMQRADFAEIFTIMDSLPVTIRLLDPPLHEFLPHSEEEIKQVASESGLSEAKIKERAKALHEANPMLGHRGCRLGITYPEIYEMQVRAIFEAAKEVSASGVKVLPEIMIPLVMKARELEILKNLVDVVAKEVAPEVGYMTGTMIELPRAALRAAEIAEQAQFFSFGTNDLTQTTCGLSRDDSANFINVYKEKEIFNVDPFVSLDKDGVGELIKIAAERGRAAKTDIKLGICGEHGGDPASIEFCQNIGLDYVSCSPFRIPVAILAAAQAKINSQKKSESESKKAA